MSARIVCLAVLLGVASSFVAGQPTPEAVLAGLKSEDAAARRQAQDEAVKLGAAAIAPLCALIAEDTPMGISAAEKTLLAIVARATAPGSDDIRQAVSAALAEQTKCAPADRARVIATRFLGLVGGADVVPALAAALDGKATFEPARGALMRIPGAQATKALLAAAAKAPAEQRPPLLLALGARRDATALRPLLGYAKRTDVAASVAALTALAQIGDVRAAKTVTAIAAKATGPIRSAAIDALLALADAQRARNPKTAGPLYRAAFDRGVTNAQRSAALIGLTATDYPGLLRLLVTALAGPGLARTASTLVSRMPDDKLAAALRTALKTAKGDARAALLDLARQRKLSGLPSQ